MFLRVTENFCKVLTSPEKGNTVGVKRTMVYQFTLLLDSLNYFFNVTLFESAFFKESSSSHSFPSSVILRTSCHRPHFPSFLDTKQCANLLCFVTNGTVDHY